MSHSGNALHLSDGATETRAGDYTSGSDSSLNSQDPQESVIYSVHNNENAMLVYVAEQGEDYAV